MPPFCFLRGTRILTAEGDDVPVEALRPGMRVQGLLHGDQPLRWIGEQRVDGDSEVREETPVRICAGALGACTPHTDLLVGPAHAVLVDGHLVAASLLVNDLTILHEPVDDALAYYHLDLPRHDCVRAEGAWTESAWEHGGNRTGHGNAAGFQAGFPQHAEAALPPCLPHVTAGDDPRLPALRGQVTPTHSPDDLSPGVGLHLLADHVRIEATHAIEGLWHAVIPAGTRKLRLRSRRTRPSMIDHSHDHRPLGVCILSLVAETATQRIEVALDHPALADGFHSLEGAGDSVWRWTDGDAVIPMAGLDLAEGPVLLTIRGCHLPLNFIGRDSLAPRLPGMIPVGRVRIAA